MKKDKRLMMGTAMVALSALAAAGARAGTVNVNVHASVITGNAIIANQTQSLNFGTFTDGGGGSVVIDPTGGIAYGGGVNTVSGSTPTQANLKVKAKAGVPVTVSVATPAGVSITNTAGPTVMAVNGFNIETAGGGPTQTISMGATTLQTVPIGATLTVGAGQGAGTYNGQFTVNVNY